jgi:hypothetical protein
VPRDPLGLADRSPRAAVRQGGVQVADVDAPGTGVPVDDGLVVDVLAECEVRVKQPAVQFGDGVGLIEPRPCRSIIACLGPWPNLIGTPPGGMPRCA